MARLTIENVTHYYKANRALCNVSATLDNGVVALVGPNGAGKTTLINSIVGLLSPTQGTIMFDGKNISSLGKLYFESVGYCPQAPHFYPNFTAYEFLVYMGLMKGMGKKELKRIVNHLLLLVNLEKQKNVKIFTFSGGMKQRLGIAQALLNNPALLILDEPTAGLDPSERIRFRNLISQISKDRIVILATHIISDVESIANQILILKHGYLIVNASPEKVLTELSNHVWCIPDVTTKELEVYAAKYPVSNVRKITDDCYEIKVIDSAKPSETAFPYMPTLEDAFLFYFHERQGEHYDRTPV